MLKEETLRRDDNGLYEEPDGELIQVIERNVNTLTVLTDVTSDKVVESPPIDPTEYTVSNLEDVLAGNSYTSDEVEAMIYAEKSGKDRTTAKEVIKSTL